MVNSSTMTMLLTSRRHDAVAPSLQPQRVLVGVDFSTASLAAARWVAKHIASDAELALAHVVSLPRIPSFLHRVLQPPRALLDQIAPEVRGGLTGLAATLGAGTPRTELLTGLPSERLAACAEDFRADMVVVGRTGLRAGTWKRIGSTADRLIRRVRVPVLIATGALTEPPRRILAAVDDGEIRQELLETALRFARRFGAELIIMHAISERVRAYAVAGVAATAAVGTLHIAADAAIREAAEEWLADCLRGAGADDPGASRATRVEIRIGDAGNEILAAAEQLDADLIIVGSYGADAVTRNGTGGVTRFVVRGARRSVLVVGNGSREDTLPGMHARQSRAKGLQQRRGAIGSVRKDSGPLPAATRSSA